MRKLISVLSGIALLGQVGNLELGVELTGQVIFKLLTLLVIFYLAARKYIK